MPSGDVRRLRPPHLISTKDESGNITDVTVEDLDDNDVIDGQFIPVKSGTNSLKRDVITGDLYVDVVSGSGDLSTVALFNFDSTKTYSVGDNTFYNDKIWIASSGDLSISFSQTFDEYIALFGSFTTSENIRHLNGFFTSRVENNTTEPTAFTTTTEWTFVGAYVPRLGGSVGFWKEYATVDQIPTGSTGSGSTTLTGLTDVPAPVQADIINSRVLKVGRTTAAPTFTWSDDIQSEAGSGQTATQVNTAIDTKVLHSVLLSGGFTLLSKISTTNGITKYTGSVIGETSTDYFWQSSSKAWYSDSTATSKLIGFK